MQALTEQQVKEIAEQLDCGFRCFIHRHTGVLISTPDILRNSGMDTDIWEKEQEELDNNFADYFEIEQLESRDSFEIMSDFTELLGNNNELRRQLITALNNKKPFREFKFVIDNSGSYRQQWFDFKLQRLKQWVSERVASERRHER